MNQIDLNGRVAVITGGAQGIGYAIAERMLDSGASVVLWDIDAGKLARGHAHRSARTARSPPTCRADRRERRSRPPPARVVAGAGQDRHPGQQRRHHRRQRHHLGARARRLAPGDRGQPGRALPDLPRRRAAHDRGRATAASSTSPRSPARKATRTPRTTAPRRPGVIALTKSLGKELATKGVLVNAVTAGGGQDRDVRDR